MNRRSSSVSGWVNFPVGDSHWTNSNEGGMLVKLVVVDSREFDQQEGECCGCSVFDTLTEVLVGDDLRPSPAPSEAYETVEDLRAQNDRHTEWMRYHYPRYEDNTAELSSQEVSAPYLAAVVMGSTGWSGWSESAAAYWTCSVADLTAEGLALYTSLKSRYPGCTIHLLTFLDT